MRSEGARSAFAALLLLTSVIPCFGADLQEIVQRGTAMIQSDWAADPDYAYVERDETLKNGRMKSKTSQVVMIEGSDYYMPLAVDDEPLPTGQQMTELEKLKAEVRRRMNEDPEARTRRIAEYRKRENENGSLLLEFPKAFQFELLREEMMDGFPAYVLSARPKRRTGPLSRAAKVLSGMKGTVWIDSENFHAIRGDCDVIAPVPIYGILARVLPGTHIEIRMAPVTAATWLVTRFAMTLMVSKFWFFNSMEVTESTYSEYRPNKAVLDELLAKADQLGHD